MKTLKLAAVAIFLLMILLPLARFRFESGIVSEIDNRKLQENPFRAEERAKKKPLIELISAYVSDRIGFRDDMILGYTLLNDRLFGEMVHPTYRYGRDGYVYFRTMTTPVYGKYHEKFADMVKKVQDYCEARGIPFLFVFEPYKQHILGQYLPVGVHYDVRWVEAFFHALDERGVHYIDNTVTLRQKMEEGENVFNRQFDAGHWNESGLFWGTNAILEELHKSFPGIRPNFIENFEASEVLESSLPVSKFPIHEYVPKITVPLENIEDVSKLYSVELERHKQYRDFGYFRNHTHTEETPRALVFQGSYLNKAGSKFLKYALGDYIIVHDYQNILELPYYFNIFKPECVVFEVAEYTISNPFFNEKKMENLRWNPPVQSIKGKAVGVKEHTLLQGDVSAEQGKTLTKIIWKNTQKDIEYVWCLLDEEFDMRPHEGGGYEVTVNNEVWQTHQEDLKIVTMENGKVVIYTK